MGCSSTARRNAGQGLVHTPFLLQGLAQVRLRSSQFGVEPQCLEVAGPGLGVPAGRAMDIAEVVVRLGKIGLKRDGFTAMRKRLAHSTKVQQELAEVRMSLTQLGIERDGPAEVRERRFGVTDRAQRHTQITMGQGIVGTQCQSGPELLRRPRSLVPWNRATAPGYSVPRDNPAGAATRYGSSRWPARTGQDAR